MPFNLKISDSGKTLAWKQEKNSFKKLKNIKKNSIQEMGLALQNLVKKLLKIIWKILC